MLKSYNDPCDIKHDRTLSMMDRVISEYFDITAPFSFDFENNKEKLRIHVFIACGSKISVERSCKDIDYYTDFIDIKNYRKLVNKKKKFPFYAHLFAEQITDSGRSSSKAPFLIARYLFDYDYIFDATGHINNNDVIKNKFIRILKKNISIDIKNNKKLPVNFISDNSFSLLLSKTQRIKRKTVMCFEKISFSYIMKIIDGMNFFYEEIMYLYEAYNEKDVDETEYFFHSTRRNIKDLKKVKFYKAIQDILNTREKIYYFKKADCSLSLFFPNYDTFFMKGGRLNKFYKDRQYEYIKRVIQYLRRIKVNWELARYCSYYEYSYEEKYNILNFSKKVKVSSGKYVFPRLDFMKTYKYVVQSCSVDDLKHLLPYIDNLKPLKNVNIKIFDRILSQGERKKITGKLLEHTNENEREIARAVFQKCDFNQSLILLGNVQFDFKDSEISLFVKLHELFSSYVSQETFLDMIPKNMNFRDTYFHICRLYHIQKYEYEYKEELSGFDINGKAERLIIDRIPDKTKSESLNNIRDGFHSVDYYYPPSFPRMEMDILRSISEITDKIITGDIVGIDTEDVIKKTNAVKSYIRKKYHPRYEDIYINDRIKDIADVISLFDRRVINPICAYKAGFFRASFVEKDDNSKKEIFKLFTCGTKNILNIINMSHIVHNSDRLFRNSGNNPISLRYKITTDLISSFKGVNTKREMFGLSSNYEWLPGINGVFETCLNGEEYVVIPLINNEELVEEGDIMHHCVGWGNYSIKSSEGVSKIFSIRKKVNDTFERISTLELAFDAYEEKVSALQNYSYRNSISDDANIIFERIRDAINSGKSKIVAWNDIKDEQQKMSGCLDTSSIANNAGYLPDNLRSIEKAMKPWLPYLDKKYHNIEAFFELPFVKERVKTIIKNEEDIP